MGVVRDGGKRSSAVIVPRTFRVPWDGVPAPKVYSPVYEEGEGYERRVEFDMSRNTGREMGKEYYRNTTPASWGGGAGRKDRWDRKERKEAKEREKEERLKEKNGGGGGGDGARKDSGGREVRKGQPPPMSVLHGYKYPVGQPKSILKRMDNNMSPPPAQSIGILPLYQWILM